MVQNSPRMISSSNAFLFFFNLTVCEKCPKTGNFSWSVFSQTRTEYKNLLLKSLSPKTGKCRAEKKSVFRHFSRSVSYWICSEKKTGSLDKIVTFQKYIQNPVRNSCSKTFRKAYVIGVVLVFLLLTLNIFHTFF